MLNETEEQLLQKCMALASSRRNEIDVPVAALIAHGDEVLAEAYNEKELLQDPTAHAEMLAIQRACKKLNSWRLRGCTLYVSLEPCLMCAGAILAARIEKIIFATTDPKAGAVLSLYNCLQDPRLNHQVEVVSYPMQEAKQLLKDYFRKLREQK